jgi:cell cycle sensor histidine kinase DivJ
LHAVLAWHLGMALAGAMGAIAAAASRQAAPSTVLALLVAGVAGLGGLWLTRPKRPLTRLRLAFAWTLAAATACLLSGGMGGPLAVLCLAPLAVVMMLRAPGGIPAGVSLSLFAAAVAVLGQLTRLTPAGPAQPVASALTLGALLGMAVGMALALRLSQRPARRSATAAPAAPAGAASVPGWLDAQPCLLLSLDGAGVVLARHGEAPPGLPLPSAGESLVNYAALASRLDLQALIRAAAADSRAEGDFAPLEAPDRVCAVSLRRASDGSLAAIVRDASRERWREAELDAARAEAEALNAGKSRFLAGMSHELRTPLNAIIGFADIMRAKLFGELTPRYADYAQMIHESGGHLLDLINDLLDMSKIEADRYQLQREVFDAREAVNAALRLVRLQADTAGISLRGVLPPEPLEADADRRALKQIVLNLVSNALKFTPPGGAVTVTVQYVGEELELEVSDTGIGIAKADLERLGRPYEQAGDADQRAKGTGLGLSLVRAFAELHGGAMAVESEVGEGTSVTVRLPVRPGPAAVPRATGGAEIIPFTVDRR